MESSKKLAFGLWVEQQALLWLIKNGAPFRLVSRNYRWRGGEVDLILEECARGSEKYSELVFIEVRARARGGWVNALESVTYPKQLKLSRTIQHFLSRYQGCAQTVRFDIVTWESGVLCRLQNVRLPEV